MEAYDLRYIPEDYKMGSDFTGKYLLPVSDSFYILRSDSDKEKYRNMGRPQLFNERYLQNPPLTKDEIFITEGIFDALSFEELDKPAIALNSTAKMGRLIETLEANKENLKYKLFIIALDQDKEGRQAAAAIAGSIQRLGLGYIIFNVGYKDVNEALTKDRQALHERLETIDLEGTTYEYLGDGYEVDQAKRVAESDIKTKMKRLDAPCVGVYTPSCIF